MINYYYQSRNKPMDSDTKAIIKSMKQISIETGYTYGHRRLKLQLNADGYRVGTHRIKTLMKMANIKVIIIVCAVTLILTQRKILKQ